MRPSPPVVLILSRFCRVGSAQNGGLKRWMRLRGTQGGGGEGEGCKHSIVGIGRLGRYF